MSGGTADTAPVNDGGDAATDRRDDASRLARQLRHFLELGAAQLDAAMRESDARVELLAAIVSSMATDAAALNETARRLGTADAAALTALHADIQQRAAAVNQHAQSAITALQFYDKLIQRLTHVRDGLAIPADSAAAVAAPIPTWSKLLEQVRARYSTVEERVLFDFMMRGLSAEQMLNALADMRSSVASGEYEAF